METQMISLLQGIFFILIFIICILAGLFVYVKRQTEKVEDTSNDDLYSDSGKEDDKNKNQDFGRFHGELTPASIIDFMDFDEIRDNMIIRKNRTHYTMVIQCNGVNYDLMSEAEKISVEEGFVQFLNILRFPIQLYVQTRSLNLRDIIEEYKKRVDAIAADIDKIDAKILQAKMNGNRPVQEKLEFEKKRKLNVINYGVDITDYVERMSSNRNVLQQKTYVVVSFYVSELGTGLDTYSNEEIDNMCFTELYTRTQNVLSGLGQSQVTGKILDSEELAELLYVAYNRDDSEVFNIDKMVASSYDSLYSTGKDVLEKKKEKINKEISLAAVEMATESIIEADKLRLIDEAIERNEKSKEDQIKEKALGILADNKDKINPRTYDIAVEEVARRTKEAKKAALDELKGKK